MEEKFAPPEAAGEVPKEKILEVPRISEKLPGVEVNFLYVIHVPEYAEEIAEAVKDADLILLEKVGDSSAERAQIERGINSVLGGDMEPGKIKNIVDRDFFLQRLVTALAGSGKQIKLIDIPSEHPSYSLGKEEDQLEAEAYGLLMEGEIEASFQKSIWATNKTAESVRAREDYVLEELSDLIPKAVNVGKVTVVMGAAHTGVHHQFAKAFPEISTRIKFANLPFLYTPSDALKRKMLYFPGKPISETEYRRAFVGDLFYTAASLFSKDERSVYKFGADLSGRLTPEELGEFFLQFTSLYKERERNAWGALEFLTKDWADKKGIPLPK